MKRVPTNNALPIYGLFFTIEESTVLPPDHAAVVPPGPILACKGLNYIHAMPTGYTLPQVMNACRIFANAHYAVHRERLEAYCLMLHGELFMGVTSLFLDTANMVNTIANQGRVFRIGEVVYDNGTYETTVHYPTNLEGAV